MSETSEALREYSANQARLRAEALSACEQAYVDLQAARAKYADAVLAAHTYGASNSAIARRVGLTETSIRAFINRRNRHDD
jgi:hypothetical protein